LIFTPEREPFILISFLSVFRPSFREFVRTFPPFHSVGITVSGFLPSFARFSYPCFPPPAFPPPLAFFFFSRPSAERSSPRGEPFGLSTGSYTSAAFCCFSGALLKVPPRADPCIFFPPLFFVSVRLRSSFFVVGPSFRRLPIRGLDLLLVSNPPWFFYFFAPVVSCPPETN